MIPKSSINSPVILTGAVVRYEDDCACSNQPKVTYLQASQTSQYVQTPGIHIEQLYDEHWLLFSPYAPGGPSVLNKAAWDRWHHFAIPNYLNQPVDKMLTQQNLIQTPGTVPEIRPAHPEVLTAWLHVTNACNLDCPYCYVRKSSEHMDESTGAKALESLFQTAQLHSFQQVKLKYAGGESTLHFKLIRKLSQQAGALSQRTGVGLDQVILSNGTHIRPAYADWIAENHIKMMVSLDGVGQTHDQLRPAKNGESAFRALEYTVDQILLPRGVAPFVTVTVTARNADGVADAVRWALARNLPVNLNFYRYTPQARQSQQLELEETAIIEGMLKAYAVFEEILPVRPFLNGLLDRVQAQAHLHTCGVGLEYVVITHKGKIAQCQMHVQDPNGELKEGDLLPVVSTGPIQNLPVHQKTGCRDCAYRYRCTGGCPIETFRATRRWDVQSPNCNIYRALFPKALRLEGLRLLKENGYLH